MFLNGFIQSSQHKSEKLVLVAASQKSYLILIGPSIFSFYIHLSCNQIFIY